MKRDEPRLERKRLVINRRSFFVFLKKWKRPPKPVKIFCKIIIILINFMRTVFKDEIF